MKIQLVAAVARGGVIGRQGAVPWRLAEDMAYFRAVTMGQPVVMGRRTWDSLPDRFRPLPGRRNVVVTHNPKVAERSDHTLWLKDGQVERLVDNRSGAAAAGDHP